MQQKNLHQAKESRFGQNKKAKESSSIAPHHIHEGNLCMVY